MLLWFWIGLGLFILTLMAIGIWIGYKTGTTKRKRRKYMFIGGGVGLLVGGLVIGLMWGFTTKYYKPSPPSISPDDVVSPSPSVDVSSSTHEFIPTDEDYELLDSMSRYVKYV